MFKQQRSAIRSNHPTAAHEVNRARSRGRHRRSRVKALTGAVLWMLMILALPIDRAGAEGADTISPEEAYPGRTGRRISVTLQTGDVGRSFDAMLIEGELVAEGDLVLGTASDVWEAVGADGRVLSTGTLDSILAPALADEAAALVEADVRLDHAAGIAGLVRKSKSRAWSDGVVPYTVDAAFTSAARDRIDDAIAHWREQTRIQFVPRSGQEDFVAFTPVDSGCSSDSLGRRGGRQELRLSPTCSYGNTVHEIGHAIGLFHEQTRPDRDAYVRVFWNNIEEGMEGNFRRVDDERAVGAYDFGSIMHYGPSFFSVNGMPTLARLDGQPLVAQRSALSDGDIQAVQAMYGIEPLIEAGDLTGAALAEGDFDGDGIADLAVGAPGEDLGIGGAERRDAGMVQVLYGEPGGLDASSSQILHQDVPDVLGIAERDDRFGQVLAAGDLNGDGYDDLVVGVPGEDLQTDAGNIVDAGIVQAFYGGPEGLSGAGDQVWNQNTPGVQGEIEAYDYFGQALAIGDLNGDGFDDLAIGVTGEDLLKQRANVADCGVVVVLYGQARGLTARFNQQWHQDSAGVLGNLEAHDMFGSRLAIGDLNGDGFDELVVGVPNEGLVTAKGNISSAGAVHVFYGSRGVLTSAGNQVWDQDKPGVLGLIEAGDRFGDALVIADFNGDRYGDLAIGVPYEDLIIGRRNIVDAGVVQVLYGRRGTLSATDNQVWDQDKPGILGRAEAYDRFGYTLAAGDVNGDRIDDLAVGVPFEDLVTAAGNLVDAGAVHTIMGASFGMNAVNNQVWDQDKDGVFGIVEAHDHFGKALAMADFGGDRITDLAIGVPGEDLRVGTESYANAGTVQVLKGSRRDQVFIEGLSWNPVNGSIERGDLAASDGLALEDGSEADPAEAGSPDSEASDPQAVDDAWNGEIPEAEDRIRSVVDSPRDHPQPSLRIIEPELGPAATTER